MSWLDEFLEGYKNISEDGFPIAQQTTINFTGDGVTVSDDAVNRRTVVHIPAGSGAATTSVEPAKVAATDPVVASGTKTIQGVFCGVGDRVLRTADGVDNGTWIVQAGSWIRSDDVIQYGMTVPIKLGSSAGGRWVLTNTSAITVGVTTLNFVRPYAIDASGDIFDVQSLAGEGTVAHAGLIRGANNVPLVEARNFADDGDIACLSTNVNNSTVIAGGSGGNVILDASQGDVIATAGSDVSLQAGPGHTVTLGEDGTTIIEGSIDSGTAFLKQEDLSLLLQAKDDLFIDLDGSTGPHVTFELPTGEIRSSLSTLRFLSAATIGSAGEITFRVSSTTRATWNMQAETPRLRARNAANDAFKTFLERTSDDGLQVAGFIRYMSPIGGGADDAPALAAAYAEMAAIGGAVQLMGGTFTWGSAHQLPATNCTVFGSPDTVINSILPADGMEQNAPFNYTPPARTDLGLLSAAGGVPGSITVVSKSATTSPLLAPGKYIQLKAPNPILRLASYKIIANDTGTKTLTLDRPLIKAFPEDSFIIGYDPIVGFRLYGNGMTITGTGDRAIELAGAWGCYVCDVVADGQFQDYVLGYDIGGYDVTFERCRCNANGLGLPAGPTTDVGYACYAFEESEDCALIECVGTGARGQGGVLLLASDLVYIADSHMTDCDQGVLVATSLDDTIGGCEGVVIVGGSYKTSLFNGINIRDGAIGVQLSNVDCSYNDGAGVLITATGGINSLASKSVSIDGLTLIGNTDGLKQDCASPNTHASRVFAQDNTNTDIAVAAGSLWLTNSDVLDSVLTTGKPMVRVSGGGACYLGDSRLESTTATNMQIIQVDTGSKLYMTGAIEMRKHTSGVLLQITDASEVWIDGSLHSYTSGGAIYGVLIDSGSKVHHNHADIDWSAATTAQIAIASGTPVVDGICGPGLSTIAMTAANKTLTWLQSQPRTIRYTGSSLGSTRTVTIEPVSREQTHINATDQSLTIVGPTGTGVTVASGTTKRLIHDGTNVIDCG